MVTVRMQVSARKSCERPPEGNAPKRAKKAYFYNSQKSDTNETTINLSLTFTFFISFILTILFYWVV